MRTFGFNDFMFILQAAQWTLGLSLIAFIGGALGGLLVALARTSERPAIERVATGYIQIFEAVEPALPEAGHPARPVDQRGQCAKLSPIVRLASFVAVAYQPGLLQDRKMLGYGRLRHLGPSRESADRLLSVAAQPLEDGAPRRIGERPEEHIVNVRHR